MLTLPLKKPFLHFYFPSFKLASTFPQRVFLAHQSQSLVRHSRKRYSEAMPLFCHYIDINFSLLLLLFLELQHFVNCFIDVKLCLVAEELTLLLLLLRRLLVILIIKLQNEKQKHQQRQQQQLQSQRQLPCMEWKASIKASNTIRKRRRWSDCCCSCPCCCWTKLCQLFFLHIYFPYFSVLGTRGVERVYCIWEKNLINLKSRKQERRNVHSTSLVIS